MNEEMRKKEEWTLGLQFFLSSRLRTAPYTAASRSYPQISVPSMVPNTQYLLDGIVWSFNDHPEWAADAWPYVQNYLRDAAERFAEEVNQLNTAIAVRQRQTAGREANAPDTAAAAALLAANSRIERERSYRAHAAVQDVYLAFCVVDALLKGCAAPPVPRPRSKADASHSPSLLETIERELPHLTADYFPVFAVYPAENTYVADAVEESRLLFLGLLESWVVMRSLEPHTVRRLEEHIRHRLKHSRETMAEGDLGEGGGADGGRRGSNAAAVQQSLDILIRGTLATTAQKGGGAGGSGSRALKAPRSAEMAERNIKSFLGSIFPSRRNMGARFRCPHCGAPFKDEKSKDAHYRYHFHSHNVVRTEDKVVRLSYPSPEDFIMHLGDIDQRGYYPKSTELLEEAYKNGEAGAVKVRRMDELGGKPKVAQLSQLDEM